jgi:hypothetical protein
MKSFPSLSGSLTIDKNTSTPVAPTTNKPNSLPAAKNSISPTVGGNQASAAASRPAMARVPSTEEKRRAQRVLLRMPIRLHIAGRATPLDAETHTVNENGAMILVAEQLAEGTKFSLENPRTEKRIDVRVVRAAQLAQGGMLVPVEFGTPSPNFWGVFFPPPSSIA